MKKRKPEKLEKMIRKKKSGKLEKRIHRKKGKKNRQKTYQNTYNTFVLSFRFHNPKVFSGKIT